MTTWDEILHVAEFAYNSSVNRFIRLSPFEVVTDLLPMSIGDRPSASAESVPGLTSFIPPPFASGEFFKTEEN